MNYHYFKNFFDKNYFNLIKNSHNFQDLTESNKPGISYRKGLYLTKCFRENDIVNFKLLRCSTNLKGPTENFNEFDEEIIKKVNEMTISLGYKAELNHVLAQIYNNYVVDGKDKKAKIKEHSDKTKDMNSDGLIVFCTFYDTDSILNESQLTKLRFRSKENRENKLDIVLHQNSLLIIPLSTNRLYTHEIIPSYLNVENIPTRLGYVIRCSNTNAIFKDNKVFVKNDNEELTELKKPTVEDIKLLKDLYAMENKSIDVIDYSIIKNEFSLNDGDYLCPNGV